MLVVSISWLYHCNIHYKDVVKHSNVVHKSIYVLLALSPLCSYSEISTCGLGLGFGLDVLTSFNITVDSRII